MRILKFHKVVNKAIDKAIYMKWLTDWELTIRARTVTISATKNGTDWRHVNYTLIDYIRKKQLKADLKAMIDSL